MTRLSLATLGNLPPSIATPAYDPRLIAIGIVHLGIGAFHRAQTAIYTDDALAQAQGPWGICGVSLRSADVGTGKFTTKRSRRMKAASSALFMLVASMARPR